MAMRLAEDCAEDRAEDCAEDCAADRAEDWMKKGCGPHPMKKGETKKKKAVVLAPQLRPVCGVDHGRAERQGLPLVIFSGAFNLSSSAFASQPSTSNGTGRPGGVIKGQKT